MNTTTTPEYTKTISRQKLFDFFDRHGKKQFGSDFRIYPEDHDAIYKMAIYFLRHTTEAARLNLNLSKGLLLMGTVGCGKTHLMTLMQLLTAPDQWFVMKPCRDVSFEFGRSGFEVIDRYSKLSYRNDNTPRIHCFDDLGPEQSIKYFGNECNVMGEIILSRYEEYMARGMITHFTTNLTADDIETFYGTRVRSRLRQMLNRITFNSASKDKRA